jgi:hypothetical protein
MHAWPQVPQFAASDIVFAQYAGPPSAAHIVCGAAQWRPQTPALHA